MGKTACSFDLEFAAAWPAVDGGASVRKERSSWAVTLPAEVHATASRAPLVLRLRIMVAVSIWARVAGRAESEQEAGIGIRD